MSEKPVPSVSRGVFTWAWAATREQLNKFLLGGVVLGLLSVPVDVVLPPPQTPSTSQEIWNGVVKFLAVVGAVVLIGYVASVLAAPYQQRNALRRVLADIDGVKQQTPTLTIQHGWLTVPTPWFTLTNRGETDTFKARLALHGHPAHWQEIDFGYDSQAGGIITTVKLRKGESVDFQQSLVGAGGGPHIHTVTVLSDHGEPHDHEVEIKQDAFAMYQVRLAGEDWPGRPPDWNQQARSLLPMIDEAEKLLATAGSRREVDSAILRLRQSMTRSGVVGVNMLTQASEAVRGMDGDAPFGDYVDRYRSVLTAWVQRVQAELRDE